MTRRLKKTLVVVVTPPAAAAVVRAGVKVRAEVDRQCSPVEREKRLREAVGELLKKYPPEAKQ
jgi:hypothetical protein